MKTVEATLLDRAGQLYRRLLILQRLFQVQPDNEVIEDLRAGDSGRDLALCAGIREVLDELTEHARVLTTIPFPLSEWRAGEGADDERWRALTEIERREVLAMANSYETLITWGEGVVCQKADMVGVAEPMVLGSGLQPRTRDVYEPSHAMEYLRDERARVTRFRQDMAFLERRRLPG